MGWRKQPPVPGYHVPSASSDDDNQKTNETIKMLIKAMTENGSNVNLLEYGCGTLSNLAVVNDDTRRTIAEEGGIKVILDAMKRFQKLEDSDALSGVSQLQKNGCIALQNLAVNDDNRETIAKVVGIKVILNAMKKNMNRTLMCRNVALVPFGILLNIDDVKETIANYGGIFCESSTR